MAHKGNGQILEKSVTVRWRRFTHVLSSTGCNISMLQLLLFRNMSSAVVFSPFISCLCFCLQVVEQNAGLLTDFEVLQLLRCALWLFQIRGGGRKLSVSSELLTLNVNLTAARPLAQATRAAC